MISQNDCGVLGYELIPRMLICIPGSRFIGESVSVNLPFVKSSRNVLEGRMNWVINVEFGCRDRTTLPVSWCWN